MTTDRAPAAGRIAELIDLEEERCRALNDQDWPALEALLSDDYLHTHSSGVVQDRETYLAYIKGSPRITSRGELQVRLYGEAAVMTGPLFLDFADRGTRISNWIIQVWVKKDDGWQTAAFQSTKLPEGNA